MQPFTHIWQDAPKDYAKSIKLFGNSLVLQARDHNFFRYLLGYNNRSRFADMFEELSKVRPIFDMHRLSQDQICYLAQIWQSLSDDHCDPIAREGIEYSDDMLVQAAASLNKFFNIALESKRVYDWLFSKEVREAVEDCVSIDSVISKSLEGVISCRDWSKEGTQHFYGDSGAIECHYVQCSIHFPNFKEFLRFKYNMSVACGRDLYRYRVKELLSKAIYDRSTVVCNNFEGFLSNFLKDVGANSKNLWDDGSNDYALFYGEDEVGVIYNESPGSGVVHYYINVPIPVIGTPEEVSNSSCKLSVFANNNDARPSVQVLHPIKSGWLDNM